MLSIAPISQTTSRQQCSENMQQSLENIRKTICSLEKHAIIIRKTCLGWHNLLKNILLSHFKNMPQPCHSHRFYSTRPRASAGGKDGTASNGEQKACHWSASRPNERRCLASSHCARQHARKTTTIHVTPSKHEIHSATGPWRVCHKNRVHLLSPIRVLSHYAC